MTIKVHGPSYQYHNEILEKPELILVRDHHYNETDRCFHLQKLLENSQCDPRLHTVVFDHINIHDDVMQNYNFIYYPGFLAREERQFNNQSIEIDWNNRKALFNFMINKPRPHRNILLELIDQFSLIHYTYSLAWKENHVNNIRVTDYKFGNEIVMGQGIKNGSYKNALTYDGLLKQTVFEPSCISLITEPVFFEREAILTEKTIMSVYSGTFPIWIGGWRCADALEQFGFDTFTDIIDHGYQTEEDPVERCRQAVQLNLELLTNLTRTINLVEDCRSRFEKNLNLLKTNVFHRTCKKIIEKQTSYKTVRGLQMLYRVT